MIIRCLSGGSSLGGQWAWDRIRKSSRSIDTFSKKPSSLRDSLWEKRLAVYPFILLFQFTAYPGKDLVRPLLYWWRLFQVVREWFSKIVDLNVFWEQNSCIQCGEIFSKSWYIFHMRAVLCKDLLFLLPILSLFLALYKCCKLMNILNVMYKWRSNFSPLCW